MKRNLSSAYIILYFISIIPLMAQNPGDAPVLAKGENLPVVKLRSRSFGLKVDRTNKSDVQKFYQEVYLPSVAEKNGWTGDVRGCTAGTNSETYQNATEQAINYFRAMAGLPADITLDPELSEKAIHAAIIFKAQKALSHSPPKNWKCWNETGNIAAGKSNIFYGISGPPAIEGYIEDPGANNYFVGHRRWILHPSQQVMGSGSTDESNALWVFGGFRRDRPETPGGVAWPPAGFVPYQFGTPENYRWSYSYEKADFSNADIRVSLDGKSLRVRKEKVVNGYGENTVVWTVSGIPQGRPASDVNVNVEISNSIVEGKSLSFKYTVRFIDPGKGKSQANVENPQASRELIQAAFEGNRAKGEIALDSGADINTLHDGWTPLMIASLKGHEDFVDLLIKNGADLNVEMDGTWTALRLAESRHNNAIVEMLKMAGAYSIKDRSMTNEKIPVLKKN